MNRAVKENGTGVDWTALQRRVAQGLATADDAQPVRAIGLLPQAIRIEQGLATVDDALLIALQVQVTGRGVAA
jgi:hypothetical protein